MIRIAVVEDDPIYTAQLKDYLERYEKSAGEKLLVTCFSDGDEIAVGYKAEYDIILLDIEMGFMDGMTAAEEIRKLDTEVVIIFITNMPQYAIKGYAVDALDYVLKPISYYAFSQRIDRAVARMQRRSRRYLYVGGKNGVQKLELSRICYVEVDGHKLTYHTLDGDVTSTGAMKDVEDSVDKKMFFRCNKGYLVNLERVDAIRGDNAVVNGVEVQISRSKKKAFLDALNDYINEVGK
ncbi:MAG: LytTR family DNA-binding domain-containing protein [Clostridiales bacterium]|nr:LytTR family DNA-binding domain-containing protein [Clostridiales bacterium]MCD7801344.1 LytTR family DNA-binding domain-containing protein [Clostridiales bacterium]